MRDLVALERHGDAVLFTPKGDGVGARVLTFGVSLTRPPKRMVAIVVGPKSSAPNREATVVAASLHTEVPRTEHRQPELRHRFRSTFNDTVGASGRVKSATFSDWMGTLRELSLASVAQELLSDFATGRWGMVTNHSSVEILGPAACLEPVEGRLRFVRAYGKFGSSIDLQFEWSRIRDEVASEVIARADMATTWVEIVGHGMVEVRPFPEYMASLIRSYLPSDSMGPTQPETRLLSDAASLGALIYSSPNSPKVKPELARYRFTTTSTDANLVGNIYYANYYRWQSEAIERLLRGFAPSRAGGDGGSLSCTFCSIAHLREAMPFDEIEVVVGLRVLHERGAQFHCEFYKFAENGQRVKLATGEYQGLWVGSRGKHGEGLPSAYVNGLTAIVPAAAE